MRHKANERQKTGNTIGFLPERKSFFLNIFLLSGTKKMMQYLLTVGVVF